jgi:hypothetical protein
MKANYRNLPKAVGGGRSDQSTRYWDADKGGFTTATTADDLKRLV